MKIEKGEEKMRIETFYTGGGIWLTEAEIDQDHYAVVGNEYPDTFAIYRKAEGEKYCSEDMVFCELREDLSDEYKELYDFMVASLRSNGALDE